MLLVYLNNKILLSYVYDNIYYEYTYDTHAAKYYLLKFLSVCLFRQISEKTGPILTSLLLAVSRVTSFVLEK